MPTTIGCKCLEGNQPTKDAFMIEKLAAGAIIIAKANLTEFRFGNWISSFKRSSECLDIPGVESAAQGGDRASIARLHHPLHRPPGSHFRSLVRTRSKT